MKCLHPLSAENITLISNTVFLCVYIPYHVLQSTIERFPDSHLADRVGHLSHGNMLAVQGRI